MDAAEIRLVKDGIQEAVCELRFETQNSPEITIGRLTDAPVWRGYSQTRLPTADVPEQLRKAEESFRFAPSYQLVSPNEASEFVRVGPNVVSCHRLAPYPGWETFGPEIWRTIEALYATVRDARITRVGFRYVNALSEAAHFIRGASDLNVSVTAGDNDVGAEFVLVYSRELESRHTVQVSLATPKFVQVADGSGFDVLIDIDVSTPAGFSITGLEEARGWIELAHTYLKQEFFRLIPTTVVDKLRG
ncbi:TIGR04255 family protein [Sphingomonas sp. ACRSK]|uniref:TIGR04255 family protein n=1 Tax=Sphingomonas sp. ACRSK TaxID=2918213 RepID=UPI001EF6ADB7|nr:TIGR04255 family protein [Sphingomonas sp. ACRSK]MCG7349310.1 TIGR04255 family protein [Sphingomonas sp. ACRSK]